MPKKKVFVARNLKAWTKFTTQNNEEQKRKSSFFIATILSFPEGWDFLKSVTELKSVIETRFFMKRGIFIISGGDIGGQPEIGVLSAGQNCR